MKRLYPNYVWDINTDDKVLYLTFDDGPTPEITEFVLEQLQKYRAKATFFCIGSNVEKYPDIFNQLLAKGHSVGNHTMNHVKGWRFSTNDYLEEVEKAHSAFQKSLPTGEKFQVINGISKKMQSYTHNKGFNSALFRPPYGQITRSQGENLNQLGYKVVMWDVLSFDWSSQVSEEKCLQNVITKSKSGSVIVFHDSLKASKNMMYAIPKLLAYFSEKGYRFESLKIS
ncbi:MAG: polysaccharide deacetylase family protein [Bacteroidota bacterium]